MSHLSHGDGLMALFFLDKERPISISQKFHASSIDKNTDDIYNYKMRTGFAYTADQAQYSPGAGVSRTYVFEAAEKNG